MNLSSVKKLNAALEKYRRLYDLGRPIISDAKYDHLREKLSAEVTKNSTYARHATVLRSVGITFTGKTEPHMTPMLSLQTFFDVESAKKFMKKSHATEWLIQPKLDGVSLSLQYKKGEFQRALLRGDGVEGEDVTINVVRYVNVNKFSGIGKKIGTLTGEVRGEVVFDTMQFASMGSKYKSARNAVAGILRRKKPTALVWRPFFVVWDVVSKKSNFGSRLDALHAMTQYGFRVVPSVIVSDRERSTLEGRFHHMPYELDGIVVKAYHYDEETRTTDHHPLWALALKTAEYKAKGKIKRVVWQVGRTGVLTPVALLEEPVNILGADIQRVTLHNFDYIKKLDLRYGDRVTIERRGGVIPKVVDVQTGGGGTKYFRPRKRVEAPHSCPSCDGWVSEDHLRCENPHCVGRNTALIEYAAKLLDVDGVGPVEAEDMARRYSFRVELALRRIGIVAVTLEQFLQLLNINNLGPQMAKAIARNCPTVSYLQSMILKAPEVARSMGLTKESKPIHQALTDIKYSTTRIREFQKKVKIMEPVTRKSMRIHPYPLVDVNIMLTGKLSVPRSEFENLVEDAGGTIKRTLTNKVSYLVIGSKPTQHKVDKARKLGVTVIDETTLRKRIDEGRV